MAKSFNTLRNKMSPAAQRKALEQKAELLAEIVRQELLSAQALDKKRLSEIQDETNPVNNTH